MYSFSNYMLINICVVGLLVYLFICLFVCLLACLFVVLLVWLACLFATQQQNDASPYKHCGLFNVVLRLIRTLRATRNLLHVQCNIIAK